LKPKHQRLAFIIAGVACLAVAVGLILNNFNSNLVFFYSPSDVIQKHLKENQLVRIGGLIENNTVLKLEDGLTTQFSITDLHKSVSVRYSGVLPPMFHEGQGMVAKGKLVNGVFMADELLTKHDEKYMPPEVADALKKSGQWKEGK
jgi:cytochrome c-type biogenesis protein CcmE